MSTLGNISSHGVRFLFRRTKLQIFLKIKTEEFFSDLKQIHNELFTCITHCK